MNSKLLIIVIGMIMLVILITGCINYRIPSKPNEDKLEDGWCVYQQKEWNKNGSFNTYDSDCLVPCDRTREHAGYGLCSCERIFERNMIIKNNDDLITLANIYLSNEMEPHWRLELNVSGESFTEILNISQNEQIRYNSDGYFWDINYVFVGCPLGCPSEIKSFNFSANKNCQSKYYCDEMDNTLKKIGVFSNIMYDTLYISNDGGIYSIYSCGT